LWFGPDGLGWLFAVSALFLLAQMLPALLRLPLGADEITYIAGRARSTRLSTCRPSTAMGPGCWLPRSRS
jgi:hypothetical protein